MGTPGHHPSALGRCSRGPSTWDAGDICTPTALFHCRAPGQAVATQSGDISKTNSKRATSLTEVLTSHSPQNRKSFPRHTVRYSCLGPTPCPQLLRFSPSPQHAGCTGRLCPRALAQELLSARLLFLQPSAGLASSLHSAQMSPARRGAAWPCQPRLRTSDSHHTAPHGTLPPAWLPDRQVRPTGPGTLVHLL